MFCFVLLFVLVFLFCSVLLCFALFIYCFGFVLFCFIFIFGLVCLFNSFFFNSQSVKKIQEKNIFFLIVFNLVSSDFRFLFLAKSTVGYLLRLGKYR